MSETEAFDSVAPEFLEIFGEKREIETWHWRVVSEA